MLRKIIFSVLVLGLSACANMETVKVDDATSPKTVNEKGEFRAPKFLPKPNAMKKKKDPEALIRKLKADRDMYYTEACLQCRRQRQVANCLKAERCEEIENCTSTNIAKQRRDGPALSEEDRRSEAKMCKEMVFADGTSN